MDGASGSEVSSGVISKIHWDVHFSRRMMISVAAI